MLPLLTLIGTGVALLGAVGLFWVNRRRFSRRNAHGVEVYTGYGHMLATRAFDTTVTAISALLVCGGSTLALYAALQL